MNPLDLALVALAALPKKRRRESRRFNAALAEQRAHQQHLRANRIEAERRRQRRINGLG
jgi:hypothetical protein